ncbi:hypothetical protein P0136_03260 [Lentisphaerota bacterium ZTH]|nr:hypothetical protein JYG24_05605 [Lentisphaerota bacterium]WET07021.1 hypothetical protein P0136_03260 [Lentisphaerota bacterium ZTH]
MKIHAGKVICNRRLEVIAVYAVAWTIRLHMYTRGAGQAALSLDWTHKAGD